MIIRRRTEEEIPVSNKDPILNFEDFQKYMSDFRGYFIPNFLGDMYRKEEPFRLCSIAHPRFVRLAAELQTMTDTAAPDYVRKLYKAYKLMRAYATHDDEIIRRTEI